MRRLTCHTQAIHKIGLKIVLRVSTASVENELRFGLRLQRMQLFLTEAGKVVIIEE